MALVRTGTFGSSPQAYYELYAEQLSGSSTSRTIKLTLGIKVSGSSSSRYGYPLNWLPLVHYSNGGWRKLKGNETWYGSDGLRWVDAQITVDVGTTGTTSIGVGFQLDMTQGSSSWETTQTASFGVGSTNTPPSMSGSITIRKNDVNGEVLSGIIPENISSIYLSWQEGSDNEQGSSGLKYGVNEIVNGGGATTILYPTTNLFHTVNIGSGNEGQTREYYVDCRDNSDALSGNRAVSVKLTKNTFTPDSLDGDPLISFSTDDITFSFGGAKNSNGSNVFTRTISCDGAQIYNNSVSNSTITVKIYRDGDTPTEPYIKFEDIKNRFISSNFKGTLTFSLATTNEYGTTKSSSKPVAVDLRVNPIPVSKQVISKNPEESLIYKKVSFSDDRYFIPNGSEPLRITWELGTGKLGELVSYEIFIGYDNDNNWQKIAEIEAGVKHYDHIISKQDSLMAIRYLIRTKTQYGYYEDAITPIEYIHYYDKPTLSFNNVLRGDQRADIDISITTNTSIKDGIVIEGKWESFTTGTTAPVLESGSIKNTQLEQTISLVEINGNGQYEVRVSYNDNTGFSSYQLDSIKIGQNLPVFFVNKYGVGVAGAKANEEFCLNINGDSIINGLIKTNRLLINGYETYTTNHPPTANEVGARPNTWMPTAEDVGAISNLSLNNSPIYDLEFDGTTFKFMDSKTPGKPSSVITGCLLQQTYDNVNWKSQILHDWRNNDIYIRAKSGGKWLPWEKLQKTSATRMLNEDYIETIISENKELKKRNINLELRLRKVEEKLGIGCSS